MTEIIQPRHIMYVCTGNLYRSPVAEGFGRKFLEGNGLNIRACSSGTRARDCDPENLYKMDLPTVKEVVKLGLARDDVFKGALYDLAKKVVEGTGFKDQEELARAAIQLNTVAFPKFLDEEACFKRRVFRRFDLGDLKGRSDQTVARPDIAAVFGMGNSHVNAARKIWEQTQVPLPRIMSPLGLYATGQELSILDPLGGSEKTYMDCAEQIGDLVKTSTGKVLQELGGIGG